jgi:CYTH domain-containing protein
MHNEIERKFLVKSIGFIQQSFRQDRIVQAYICSGHGHTVRVRIKGDKAYLTIKGKSFDGGISRLEWEKEISLKDAEDLLQLCQPGIIDKIRYEVKSGKHIIEIDVFHGENEGLIVAEIELNSVEENWISPDWLGEEVTGQNKYTNASLAKFPYSSWDENVK